MRISLSDASIQTCDVKEKGTCQNYCIKVKMKCTIIQNIWYKLFYGTLKVWAFTQNQKFTSSFVLHSHKAIMK